jgi:hypothetical protein
MSFFAACKALRIDGSEQGTGLPMAGAFLLAATRKKPARRGRDAYS